MFYARIYSLLVVSLLCSQLEAQTGNTKPDTVVTAGPEYARSGFHQWLWGKNRRKEWSTPVHAPVWIFDTVHGGLVAYKAGGGNETKSLRLRTAEKKNFALRSINKSRHEVIPPEFKNTFVANIVEDGISMSHPYGAFAVPGMLQAAGIYHTRPRWGWVPAQPALDTFNKKFGYDFYLLEQRPDGDWSESVNLGNFSIFEGTYDVMTRMHKDNRYQADQRTFIKARLFDFLINDWDKHEDNWEWGIRDTSKGGLYVPIPKDRDQVFYTHDGFLIDRVIGAAGLGYMQHFDHSLKDVRMLNWEMRNLDRFFSNEMTMEDWRAAAAELQRQLTDTVISNSVKGMPPEIYAIAGQEMTSKLISRRQELVEYAKDYYLFLAEEVEITGSNDPEVFEVRSMDDGTTSVKIYRLNNNGTPETSPYYARTFTKSETKEVRIYGIGGNDRYTIEGNGDGTTVRIIGGPDRDTITQQGNAKVYIYDNSANAFATSTAKLKLTEDTAVHSFRYYSYQYDKKGLKPVVNYNQADRLYVGLQYGSTNYKWRRPSFASKVKMGVNYSISQKAFSAYYDALHQNLIGSIDLLMLLNYDQVRWTNYYGLGNHSVFTTRDRDFHRMRSEEWLAEIGFGKKTGSYSLFIGPYYHQVRILSDTGRYLHKSLGSLLPPVREPNRYAGMRLRYSYTNINDSVVPTKGIHFVANGNVARNFRSDDLFSKVGGNLQIFLPLFHKFSLRIGGGGEAVLGADGFGNVQLAQHATIGGGRTLRGYRAERFWGESAVYNNNELRFITDIRTHLMNARFGLLAFYDQGRVWIPNEKSSKIHSGYGGGVILAPFNKLAATVSYGISEEGKFWQIKLSW